jgi:hypothetical protein
LASPRSPGQAAKVDGPLPRRAAEIEYEGRQRLEPNATFGLFGVDFTCEGMPAARFIKCKIVRLAEQQREMDGFVVADGLYRSVERDAGIALSARVATPPTPPMWNLRPFQITVRK